MKQIIDKDSKLIAELIKLKKAADQARESYDYETAVSNYSHALDLGRRSDQIPPAIEYELRSGRASCYSRMGNWEAESADLDTIIDLGEEYNETYWQADALARKIISFAGINTSQSKQYAERILNLAEESGDKTLRALGLRSLAVSEAFSGDHLRAIEHLEEALKIYRMLGDKTGEANCLWLMSRSSGSLGDQSLSREQADTALSIYRALGDRVGEANALRYLGIYAKDYAQRRSFTEEALQISETLGDLPQVSIIKNNLGLQYARIGLYETARAYLESAVHMQRETQSVAALSFTLESLGRIYFDLGLLDQAEICIEESLHKGKEKGFYEVEATCWLGLGRLALDRMQLKTALKKTQIAIDMFSDTTEPANSATAQAWQGMVYLELGDWQNAYVSTSNAISTLKSIGDVIDEFPPQDVYWLHYQVLTSPLNPEKADGSNEEAWQTLQRAHELVFTNIDSLSDAGIRRNYLNKIAINRQILSEWRRQAQTRGFEIEPLALAEGNLQDQFKRLLSIGLRMNEQRETESLLQFILDQLIELSGAERTLIVSVDASGERRVLAIRGFSDSDQDYALVETAEILDEATRLGRPLLKDDRTGGDDNNGEDYFEDLSIMIAPLFSGGRLRGLIYMDNHILYEPFNQIDLDLLAAFSNQAASALDNAQLYQGLEQRVQERTLELQAANAELAVINRVQESLAAELDMQAIYDLVGDQIQELFDAQAVVIISFDENTEQDHYHYILEKGVRYEIGSAPLGIASRKMIETRQPLVLNTVQSLDELGLQTVPGTEESKSFLGIPLIVSGVVKGTISLQNIDREYAFSDSDVRLLSTLANSMSVALENARLFEETKRLLEETRQRNAELAVINSVQEGLVAELDVETIYNLVGDQIRDIFDAQAVVIGGIDEDRGEFIYHYAIEKGIRYETEPEPFSYTTRKIIETREPLILNPMQARNEIADELAQEVVPGTEPPKSFLGVPLIVGGVVKGIISLQNVDRDNAFDDADVRLLSTLANSMSVALENARLFDETNRLLDETEQRAAELSIINSVGEAMAKQLDVDTVTQLVGDKVRDIFNAEAVMIMLHDQKSNMLVFRYSYDKAEGGYVEANPVPFGAGVSTKIIQSQQPMLYNTSQEGNEMGAVLVQLKDKVLDELEQDTESFLGVPIIIGQKVLGVISVQSYLQFAYQEDDLRLLSTLAANMGVAIENARLFEETNLLLDATRQQAAELAIINSVGEAMAKQLDVETIARIVGDKVRDIFEAEVTQIFLFDSQAQICQAIYAYDRGYLNLFSIPFGKGLTSKVIDTRLPLVTGTQEEGADKGGIFTDNAAGDGENTESYMGIPIIVGDKVIGVVDVQSYRQNAFDDGSVRLLSTLATNMGVAIENARLFDEIKHRANEMAALTDIGRDISATLDLEAVLESITTNARDLLEAQTSAVIQLEADGETLKPIAVVGENAEEIKVFNWKLGQGIIGHIVQSGEAEQIEDAARDSRAIHISGTDETEEIERMMVAPLTSKDGVSGAMVVWRRGESNIFSKEELDFLIGISRQASIAIQNARLFEDAQRRAREMAALTEIGREISATLDIPTVLERIATRARDELNARDVVLRLLEPDGTLPTVVAIGKYKDVFKADVIQIGQGLTGNVAKTGIAEMVNYPMQDPRMVHVAGTGREEEEADEAIIFAPLILRDNVIGVMALWRQRSEYGPFMQNDLDFLVGLARQAAIAIENARLFDEIQRQKQYSDALVETSPVAIVTTDLAGDITSWNPGAEKLFQYTQGEAIGQNLDSLVATTETMRAEAAIFSDQAKEGRLNLITKRTRKDGQELDVELAAVPVVVDQQTVGLIVIYHDITELQGARQEAEAANQAKSAFLATMSHEIRTPMNAVIGMSGLLLDTTLTEEQYEFVEIIRNSGDALLTIINDILDFSKIEAGKMELENQPFDLRECVEGTLDLVASKAFEKGLDLAYLIDEYTPATFSGDMTRLRQILLNMFTNAIKFTETGEVVLTIKSQPIRRDSSKTSESDLYELQFAVRDTGIGIPKERMDRLFQSFSQVDASTARKYGGTGLGLAISKRLSEMMGGRMWVESEVGEGTTFYFTIRAKVVDQPVVTRPDLAQDQPQLSGRKVLIVDDNETNLRILKLQVEKWGMESIESSSPKQALDLVKNAEHFDVAILDMHMPDMDGLMLAAEIRQYPAGSNLPLILFTSLGRRELHPEGIEFAAHLTKPIKPSQLFDALVGIFVDQPVQVKKQAHMPEKPDTSFAGEFPLRILLTEDNAVNQKLALRLLEKMGYRADVAGNGLEALEALERQSYDVILMDVQMPEMDGLEATRQIIKRWGIEERPQIIAMTANAMQGDREMCLAAGMDDYIAKPLRVEEILAALKRSKLVNPKELEKNE